MIYRYAHLESNVVNVGQHVDGGNYIGEMGNLGNSTGPHVHLQIGGFNQFTDSERQAANVLYDTLVADGP